MGDTSLFDILKKSFTERHEALKKHVSEKHKDALALLTTYPTQIMAGAMGGLAILNTALPVLPPSQALAIEHENPISPSVFLISDLTHALPSEVQPLTDAENATVSAILTKSFGMKVTPTLSGIQLNRTYGLIGAEQHLARYPGDNMNVHFDSPAGGDAEAVKYANSGMAPGLGAWGYFARSRYDLTPKDIDREKYYIAVQTFLAPGFHENVRRYIEFFKYRKILIVNPQNGKAMVVDIGDAGPGESTGKHLGGSPEVMKYLERFDGAQRGPVLYFFIDDPKDTIPLGPVEPK